MLNKYLQTFRPHEDVSIGQDLKSCKGLLNVFNLLIFLTFSLFVEWVNKCCRIPNQSSQIWSPQVSDRWLSWGKQVDRGEWMVVKGEQRESSCLRKTELKVPCSQKYPAFQEKRKSEVFVFTLWISRCLQLNLIFFYYNLTLQAKQNMTLGQIWPTEFAISTPLA